MQLGGMEELFQAYGVRHLTLAKIAELGFTVNTLLDMKEEELEDMMNSVCHIFRWDLMVGERYGIKAAVRAHRRRLDHLHLLNIAANHNHNAHSLDALSQEGLSEEPVQRDVNDVNNNNNNNNDGPNPNHVDGGNYDMDGRAVVRKKPSRRQKRMSKIMNGEEDEEDEEEEEEEEYTRIRQREHPFIVTEPGEVARGKKNGLDYLFHLYEQCREFLIQVQNLAKDRGEKCPTKVTNQVFRFAKKAGANYINKPKMRHYVHCYALHCLDETASDALRRAFKERGENVGQWRQACYQPLVAMAGRHGWDIDALFNSHPRLAIWYVPTRLRQLCHAQRHLIAHAAASAPPPPPPPHLPF